MRYLIVMRKKVAIFGFSLFLAFLLAFPANAEEAFDFQKLSENLPEKITLVAEKHEESVSREEYSLWFQIRPFLEKSLEKKSEIENIYYCPSEKMICFLTLSQRDKYRLGRNYQAIIDRSKLESFLEDLAREINKDPVNAKFEIAEGRVAAFITSEPGMRLDIPKSLEITLQELKNFDGERIVLAYEKVEPEIKSSDAESLGIETLIGEGKSNFRGSPKNRIHNIKVATSRFNGLLIKPGEEFSFVTNLGEVDGEHGYAPELVIKKDKTEPEFGGGICQVSTTAFRAAIYSGMEITARRNHAYPVAYYNPQGMDATVYIPRPDLRFINNTAGHILIQTKIEGTELIFHFYGKNDGRKIEIEGPKITERNPDGSMKAYFIQKVYDKDGKVILEDTFKSAYDSPSKYPHPGEEKLTKKPSGWSDNEWRVYKKANGI